MTHEEKEIAQTQKFINGFAELSLENHKRICKLESILSGIAHLSKGHPIGSDMHAIHIASVRALEV